MDSKLLILVAVAIVGVYLFGAGISGMAAAGLGCSAESCGGRSTLSAVIGVMLLGAVSAAYFHRQRTVSARKL